MAEKSDKKCKALALSGGGSKMSYFGGAIYGLIEKQSADEFEWDVITGASAGSIYATLMGLWPKGKKAKWQSSSSLISMV